MFPIYGGTVSGGVANDTTLTLTDGTTKACDSYGGNIYAQNNSVVTIAGGVVENGYSGTYGTLSLMDSVGSGKFSAQDMRAPMAAL